MVSDAETGEPLVGTNILVTARWIEDTEVDLARTLGAASNEKGEYFIINLSPGFYSVKAIYIGYAGVKKTKVRVLVDKTARVNFSLNRTAVVGEEVTVVGYRPEQIDADLTATRQNYLISEIEDIGGVYDIADIIDLQADVVDNHFRGGREGESSYLVDGSSIMNPLTNSRTFSPMVIGLQQVEVLTSGFGAEYGNAQSGVINMVMKEGGEKWHTTIEMSNSLPHYKYWGGNIYSKDNFVIYNPAYDPDSLYNSSFNWYDTLASDPNAWSKSFGAITIDEQLYMWGNLLSDESTAADTLFAAKMRQADFINFFQDIGRDDYKSRPDYRVDFSTGGPISDNLSIFIAARQETNHSFFAAPQPEITRQLMGNTVYNLDNNKFKLSYTYNIGTHQKPKKKQYEYAYMRKVQRVGYTQSVMKNIGFQWKHIFSRSTYSDIKIKRLGTFDKERVAYVDPTQYIGGNNYAGAYSLLEGHGLTQAKGCGDRGDEETNTYSFDGSIVSQINQNHLLKAGLQYHYYKLNVKKEYGYMVPTGMQRLDFSEKPYEGALHFHDKMEFGSMIANFGLRLDFYNFNTECFSDVYSPLRNPEYDSSLPYIERGKYYDSDLALMKKTKLYTKLQPRLGISFPLTQSSVVHFNYGTFTQRANFNRIFYWRIDINDMPINMGNPRLKPENTTSYDIGLVQGLPLGIRLDVSAYYKDVKDLLETAYYTDSQLVQYRTYYNRDYADIKGFHVSLEKRGRNVHAIVRYNYQSAKGKASTYSDAPVHYYEATKTQEEKVEYPDPEDIYLDYDRTHRLVGLINYSTLANFGPKLMNVRPLGNLDFNVKMTVQSGRPYTWDEEGLGLKMNERAPGFADVTARVQKAVRVGETKITFYLEAYNLLNNKELNYSVFRNDDTKARYDEYVDGDQDIGYVMTETEYSPYMDPLAFDLYRNQPRSYRIGMKFNL